MFVENIVISASVTVLALGLLIVSLVSYRKHHTSKLLFISLVFLLFLLKGILFSLAVFFDELAVISSNQFFGLFDLLILATLFLATLKR